MIHSNNTAIATPRSIEILVAVLHFLPVLMLLTTLMSLSACKTARVIPADQLEKRIKAGQSFTPPADGWYMNDARYQRYRRAVADKILELETAK